MMSNQLRPEQNIRATYSYGSFNTRLYEARYDSGRFGPGGKSNLMVDLHQMKSDGYQTFNFQRRNAFSAKYQYAASPRLVLTGFTSIVELKSNTPDTKVPTRANAAQFGDNYLMVDDPAKPNYYKYNFYHILRTSITSDSRRIWATAGSSTTRSIATVITISRICNYSALSFWAGVFPPPRGGVAAPLRKMSRSLRSGADGVVDHKPCSERIRKYGV